MIPLKRWVLAQKTFEKRLVYIDLVLQIVFFRLVRTGLDQQEDRNFLILLHNFFRFKILMNQRVYFLAIALFLSINVMSQEDSVKKEFVVLEYGFPQGENYYLARDFVSRKWNVFYKRVGLCMVDDALVDSVSKHNRMVFLEIAKAYGDDWHAAFYNEIEREYDRIVQTEIEKALADQIKWAKELHSTEPKGAIETTESHILFRGYDNKITPAVTNNKGLSITLKGINCSLTGPDSLGNYVVRPGASKKAIIELFLIDKDTLVTVKKVEYDVLNLPDPIVFFGNSQSGSKVNVNARNLEVRFQQGVALNFEFEILSWTVYYQNETYSGTGSNISAAKNLCDELKVNSDIRIKATVFGSDGIKRSLEGWWDL